MEYTIKEWLSGEFGEPYQTQALANLKPENENIKVPSLHRALLDAFSWETSPEGFDYWNKIYAVLFIRQI